MKEVRVAIIDRRGMMAIRWAKSEELFREWLSIQKIKPDVSTLADGGYCVSFQYCK